MSLKYTEKTLRVLVGSELGLGRWLGVGSDRVVDIVRVGVQG